LAAGPELHKKWHPAGGKQANGSLSAGSRHPGCRETWLCMVADLARYPARPVGVVELPPLTQFEEDYFAASAEC
jgi:hypothetical protein